MARHTVRLTIETRKLTSNGIEVSCLRREFSVEEQNDAAWLGLDCVRAMFNQLRRAKAGSGKTRLFTDRKDDSNV